MRQFRFLSLAAAFGLALTAPLALQAQTAPKPKGGTIKGAAVGGIAGHVMGGHTKTGMAVGALAGHHEKVKSQERINEGKQP